MSEKFQSFDKLENTSRSSASNGSDENAPQIPKTLWRKILKYKMALILGIFVLFSISAFYVTRPPELNYQNSQFNFYAYCPLSYEIQYISQSTILGKIWRFSEYIGYDYGIDEIKKNFADSLNMTYVVRMQSNIQFPTPQAKKAGQTQVKIKYCGFARKWDSDCSEAQYICSNPGPAFDVQENHSINVIWVNQIDVAHDLKGPFQYTYNQTLSTTSVNKCFGPAENRSDLCDKKGKSKQWENLTYLDPTQMNEMPSNINCQRYLPRKKGEAPPKNITVSGVQTVPTLIENYPVSTHVHGLQVRPLFDGNPESWFDNNKQNQNKGLGYATADSPYFKVFGDYQFDYLSKVIGIHNLPKKINNYPNTQQPGTLWYHDHAMGITGFNVGLGLNSFYIIRNSEAEKDLPKGKYQKLLYIYGNLNETELLVDCTKECQISDQKCQECNQNNAWKPISSDKIQLNCIYRIRILNGDFTDQYTGYAGYKIKNDQGVEVENKLNFTVIGTDSSLKAHPVPNVEQLFLAPAERNDILIDFTPAKGASKIFMKVTSHGNPQKIYYKEFQILQNSTNSPGRVTKMVKSLNVPYENLNDTAIEKYVDVERMRPLVWNRAGVFGINGHLRFMTGASENPKIGSIEDWYFINTITFGHPIHVHLIQFQILEYYSLIVQSFKNSTNTCSIYEMQLFRQQNEYNKNHKDQCSNMELKFNDAESLCEIISVQFKDKNKYLDFFKCYKVETVNHANYKKGESQISGLDLFTLYPIDGDKFYNLKEKSKYANPPKYLFFNETLTEITTEQNLRDYQKGWKDTVWVPTLLAAKIRIRWASTDYPQSEWSSWGDKNKCNRKFFKVNETELIQFPGFLYHCHILRHEDNEMMRPIMMQPSGCEWDGAPVIEWKERWEQLNCQIFNYMDNEENGELRRRALR